MRAKRKKLMTARVDVRFTPAELQELDDKAVTAGRTRSDFVRSCIVSRVIQSATDAKMLSELGRAGRLVKKIWSEGAPADATRAALSELQHTARKIADEIGVNHGRV